MDALQCFEWHAYSGNAEQSMWDALRLQCKNLTSIATNTVGSLCHLDSSLSSFSGLESFSLTLIPECSADDNECITADTSGNLPDSLWDMLLSRCPDLRSLSIESNLNSPISARRLLDGNWQELRALRLGPITLDDTEVKSAQDIALFLQRHPTIEQLSLRNISVDLSLLPAHALPNLEHLTGGVDDLSALCSRGLEPPDSRFSLQNPQAQFPDSSLSRTLKSLTISEPIPLGQSTPFAMYSMLVGLRALTSLKAVFSADGDYDPLGVLKTIVAACPQLQDLDLQFTTGPSLTLAAFSQVISRLRKLNSLRLTIVRAHDEEDIWTAAPRFALSNYLLRDLVVTYILPEAGLAHEDPTPAVTQEARFTVEYDAHDVPASLLGAVTAPPTSTRDVRRLPLRADPAPPTKAWGRVVFEQNQAGQEARMYAFAACALAVAACGVAMGLPTNVVVESAAAAVSPI